MKSNLSKDVVQHYIVPLLDKKLMSAEDIAIVFSNWQQLLMLHKKVDARLSKAMKEDKGKTLGDALIRCFVGSAKNRFVNKQ